MKAVLVIDMPSSCSKCRLKTAWFNPGGGITIGRKFDGMMVGCKLIGDCGQMFNAEGIPMWCPLKPLPKREEELSIEETIIEHKLPSNKYVSAIIFEKAIKKAMQRGYNVCLDEILREEDNNESDNSI